jgi:hypothetical protein
MMEAARLDVAVVTAAAGARAPVICLRPIHHSPVQTVGEHYFVDRARSR